MYVLSYHSPDKALNFASALHFVPHSRVLSWCKDMHDTVTPRVDQCGLDHIKHWYI